jgi:Na+/proline symporter
MDSTHAAGLAAILTCCVFAAVGAWHARRAARGQHLDDYLTARGSIGTGLSVATLVATLAGTWIISSPALMAHFYGPAAVLGYCLGQALPMWIFPLVGNRVRARFPTAATLSDVVGTRYGVAVRVLVSLLGLFYMGVYLAVELTTIAQTMNLTCGWSLGWAAALVALSTVIYAAWGGVRTAIAVDRLQVGLIVALVAVVTYLAWHAAGPDPLAVAREKGQLAWTADGWQNAGVLVLGIVASNLFDNSFWARLFACRDAAVVRRSFTLSGIAIGVILIPASLMGWWAAGIAIDDGEHANSSMLPVALITAHGGVWTAVVVLVLALLLAMSTVSALFNGLVGVLTADARACGAPADRRTLLAAKIGTAVLALPAVWVASFGADSTYLFFIANLVCAAAVVPVFLGLWATRLTGAWVLAAFLLALVPGVLFFPKDMIGTPWLDISFLGGQRFLTSYVLALGLSTVVAVVGATRGRGRSAD